MNLRALLLAGAAAVAPAVAGTARAQSAGDPGRPSAAQVARIDSIFAKWDRRDSPGCAVSVSRDSETLFEKGYGMSNLEYDVPITPQSIFHVASMSKEFTALSVVLLVEQRRLSLDDDVRKYIPELPDYGQRITLRQLLHHTSGIRDQWELLRLAGWRDDDPITMDDILDILARQKELNFAPGSQFLYSNSGFTLLAEVVHRVSGKTLRQFAQENIFAPLGMTHTHFHDDHTMIVPGRTSAYVARKEGGWAIRIPVFDNAGATSLFTTVEDLAKWNANFTSHRIGGDAGWAMMQERFVLTGGDTIPYALGLVHGRYRGLATIGHNGSDAGYRSDFTRFADSHVAVSVLCNTPPDPAPAGLAQRVADVVLSDRLQPVPPKPATKAAPAPAADLASLPGVYWAPQTESLVRIEARGDSLVALRGPQAMPLVPVGQRRYRAGIDPVMLTFSGTGAGRRIVQSTEGERASVTWEVMPAWAHPPTAAELQPFAGRYYGEEVDNTYTISLRGDTLHLRWRKSPDLTLRPAFADAFALGGTVLRFQRDVAGQVTGFRLSGGRVRHLRFVKE